MQIMQIGFFQYIFYQYSIIWIKLNFYFFNFIIRWSILGSTFYQKAFVYTMILKKLFNSFELIWNLIFPQKVTRTKNFPFRNSPSWIKKQKPIYLCSVQTQNSTRTSWRTSPRTPSAPSSRRPRPKDAHWTPARWARCWRGADRTGLRVIN